MTQYGTPLDRHFGPMDIAGATMQEMRADCADFLYDQGDVVGDRAARAGRDFWIERCRLGASFLDGDWPEPDDSILHEGARRYGPVRLHVGDDGLIRA
jgi:hypothetical protein